MPTQDEMKQTVAQAALEFVEDNCQIGVGTGSTANYFIDALADYRARIDAAVASSEATAERLRQRMATTGVQLPNGTTLHVTVSMGVAVFPEHGDQERTLLRRADLAMYQAKESGRNRVSMWGEIPD